MKDLDALFDLLNRTHFQGELTRPILRWNARLRTTAGRFTPGSRKWLALQPPIIEIAQYLLEETLAEKHISDTLVHEMVHYWLWSRRRPYGHTEEFLCKLTETGATRYNPVPRQRPIKHFYQCPGCRETYPRRRRYAARVACAACCQKHGDGRFDRRFVLELVLPSATP